MTFLLIGGGIVLGGMTVLLVLVHESRVRVGRILRGVESRIESIEEER